MLSLFLQAEDGIRDIGVTGVQTCALPISPGSRQTQTGRSSSSGMQYSHLAGAARLGSTHPEDEHTNVPAVLCSKLPHHPWGYLASEMTVIATSAFPIFHERLMLRALRSHPAISGPGRTRGSLVVLGLWPQLSYRDRGFRGHIHRHTVLLRYTVAASDGRGPLSARVHLFKFAASNPHGDQDLARAAPRSPEVVVVMPAYGPRKAVSAAQEVQRAGLPVVGGEDAGLGALFCGKSLVDARHGARHILPPEPVPE